MLRIYQGDLKTIKEEIEKLFRNSKVSKLKFSKNIMSEKFHGLFYEPTLFYFLYDKEFFKDKEIIDNFIKFAESTDSIIVCIIEEELDKKTIIYKKFKPYIKTISTNKQNKVDYKAEILKDLSCVYLVDNSKFISILFSLSYSKYKQSAGFVLSLILTGRMNNTELAKKLFITLATMKGWYTLGFMLMMIWLVFLISLIALMILALYLLGGNNDG